MKQAQVKLYCDPPLRERITKAADKDGRSVSKWLIKAAEEKMIRDKVAK